MFIIGAIISSANTMYHTCGSGENYNKGRKLRVSLSGQNYTITRFTKVRKYEKCKGKSYN